MRIYLALAVTLFLAGAANAQDVGRQCSAEADAQALHGRDRVNFVAHCRRAGRVVRATRRTVTTADGEVRLRWHEFYPQCSGNVANTLIGACPLCVPLLSLFELEKHCYVQ